MSSWQKSLSRIVLDFGDAHIRLYLRSEMRLGAAVPGAISGLTSACRRAPADGLDAVV
jgi:hypothetical protein